MGIVTLWCFYSLFLFLTCLAFLESGFFSTLELCIAEHSIVHFVWGLKIVFHSEQYNKLLICVLHLWKKLCKSDFRSLTFLNEQS